MKTHVTTVTMICDQCETQIEQDSRSALPEGWVQIELQINYAWRKGGDFCSTACVVAYVEASLASQEVPA